MTGITFGFQLPNFTYGTPDEQIFEGALARVQAAESSGFESVWVMDHFYQLPALGGSSQAMLEGYTLLGALAARTSRVQLGTLVTGVTYRNPALLAKEVTTVDIISGGRAILGIGAAWHDEEHIGLGVDFPGAKERLDRLEEALQICRAMFTQETSSFDGRYYRTNDARNIPHPLRGDIPIMVGGSGEKRTLKLVAQYADLCNIHGGPAEVRRLNDVIDAHCATVGRDPAQIKRTRLASLFVCDSDAQADEMRAFVRSIAPDDPEGAFDVGVESEVTDKIGALHDAGLDTLIYNMPLSDANAVERGGKFLQTI
ncbi:MAG TPA: LLM class F420-dependent oxidoreductase [Acidimicrobiia bacterium]